MEKSPGATTMLKMRPAKGTYKKGIDCKFHLGAYKQAILAL